MNRLAAAMPPPPHLSCAHKLVPCEPENGGLHAHAHACMHMYMCMLVGYVGVYVATSRGRPPESHSRGVSDLFMFYPFFTFSSRGGKTADGGVCAHATSTAGHGADSDCTTHRSSSSSAPRAAVHEGLQAAP